MKVIKSKKLEGCIEGSNVYDLLLSEQITKEFIINLSKLGKLSYHASIMKPYFTIISKGKFTIKGVQGNSTIRILLPEDADEQLINVISEELRSC